MAFFGISLGARRKVNEPVVPVTYNYPPSTAGDTGITTMPVPKGLSAPIPMERPDVILDQRLSERIQAFAPRLPIQNFLREQRVVQVIPQTTNAHHLYAPSDPTNVDSSYAVGRYTRDYTLQTDMGKTHAGSLKSPPQLQSIPGYVDVGTTVAINGQYASINANLSSLYTNLRAPTPFEGMASCQS